LTPRPPGPPLEPSADLLAACRAGDREAFAQLFDMCRDRVYSTAVHLSGDRTAAADIAQDVFMKVLTRLPQYQSRSSFATWLYRIVVNTVIDHHRAAKRIVSLEDAMPVPEAQSVDAYTRLQRRRRIEAALQSLPDILRVPVVLRHVQGLRYEEIAEALDISPGTVASRLSRAHARLAHELAELATEEA
jgi:RNA polymerase sigma-70 factor (ECF subfamily)